MIFELLSVVMLVALVAWLAATRGGQPERLCAIVIIAGVIVDLLLVLLIGTRSFREFDVSRITLDGLQLTAFVVIALRANRNYPIFIAASQNVSIIGSLSAVFIPDGMTMAFWAMTQLPLFMQLVLLAGGTWAHSSRVALVGEYNAWSPFGFAEIVPDD